MHYYKRHIGDYAKKAGKLSMLQHGAYTMLLDAYYDGERPPTKEQAMEWCWAFSPEEVAAVEFVLGRFFKLDGDLYRQNHCDEDIEIYHGNAATNKRIALDREEKKRQKKARTVHASYTNEHEPAPNHKPLTINHKPEIKGQETCAEPQAASPPKSAKASFDYSTGLFSDLSAEMLAAWREAYPATDVRQEIAKAKAWLLANPKNRKSNIERFLTNWLTKAQDSAPRQGNGPYQQPPEKPDTSVPGRIRAAIERERAAAGGNPVAVANDGVDVRTQMGEQLRRGRGPGEGVGELLEGDYRRAD